jgi:hypothetical protein
MRNKKFLARHKTTGFETYDYQNKGGNLTTYIKENEGVEIPTLFFRKKYFNKNGKHWYEQWFEIIELDLRVKKCPYCVWETVDVDNMSGMFETHLNKIHNIDKETYLKEFPNEREYFRLVNKTLDIQLETDESKFVICKICGKKLKRIDWKHLNKHNITLQKYKERYCGETYSNDYSKFLFLVTHANNMNLGLHNNIKKYVSKPEFEIYEWLISHNINVEQTNRKLLKGKEIDLFLPDYNIAIEYNGNKWHTEWFGGKTRFKHIEKTNLCNEIGVRLIQIFEDEYILHKDIVFNTLSHILKINDKQKIQSRNCNIREINNETTSTFLIKNHIQGECKYTYSFGQFYKNELVGVMTFKKLNTNSNEYELSRFSTNHKYNVIGAGGKLLSHFIKNYNPSKIKSFADIRWVDKKHNLYEKLGFTLVKILKPNYSYYNPKIDRHKRYHKFLFRKQILSKKYGFPLVMTETEMIKKLGYDRIWDCGLIKYEWYNKKPLKD